jgi:hypothetical protein
MTDASSGVIHAFVANDRVRAYRADGEPMTERDWSNVFQCFQKLAEPPTVSVPIPVSFPISVPQGITPADVLNVFPGARIVEQLIDEPKPSSCSYCDTYSIPEWRRGGTIIQRVQPDGTRVWACHFCGRRAARQRKTAA